MCICAIFLCSWSELSVKKPAGAGMGEVSDELVSSLGSLCRVDAKDRYA